MERLVRLLVGVAALLTLPAAGLAQTLAPAASHVHIARADLAQLRDIQLEGRQQVATLAERLRATPPGPAALALERRIEQVKLESRLRFLDALATWARRHGNPTLAAQSEQTAQQLRSLVQPPPRATDMPFTKARPAQEVRP